MRFWVSRTGEVRRVGVWQMVIVALLLWASLLVGCSTIPIHEQGLATKPNMGFGDSLGSAFDSSVISQIEPGSGIGNGGQAAGCIACR